MHGVIFSYLFKTHNIYAFQIYVSLDLLHWGFRIHYGSGDFLCLNLDLLPYLLCMNICFLVMTGIFLLLSLILVLLLLQLIVCGRSLLCIFTCVYWLGA